MNEDETKPKQQIDGQKIEIVIRKIYDLFEENEVTGNEGCAIAGMILSTSSAYAAKRL